jgi:DNA-binding SARP family transcriptional activator
LLGPVEFLVNGKRVEAGTKYRIAVLAALLYDAGGPVQQEELIRRVWDSPTPGARSSLYAHISRLRQVFAKQDPAVELGREGTAYTLRVPAGSVDLTRFRDLVRQGHDASCDEDRAALLGRALGYWRGLALSGLETLWAVSVRETLTKQKLAASALRAQAQARLGAWDQLVTEVSDLLVIHPLSEPLAFELIRTLYVTGRKSEALDWYARTRQRMRAELGVEPGRELRDLHLEILNEEVPMLWPR